MDLDVTLLTTEAECDIAIEITQAELILISRRLRNLGESLEDKAGRVTAVKEGIVSVEAIIGGYQAAVAVLTEGKEKRELELEIAREEAKLKSLQNRDANYSAVNVVEDQIDHQQLSAQIPILEAAIAAIEAHKATLGSGRS